MKTKIKTNLIVALGIGVVLSIASCRKSPTNEDLTIDEGPTEKTENIIQFLSKDLEVDESKINYDEESSRFVIDEDGLMDYNDAEFRYDNQSQGGLRQRVYNYTVNSAIAPIITIYVPSSIPSIWITPINDAITNWNATDCLVKLKKTSNANTANINFSTIYLNSGVIARAYYPTADGKPGHSVQINTKYNTGLTTLQRVFAITHEFGHNLGFPHTNQTDGSLIPNTPNSDPNSVMNSTVLPWEGFTPYDIIAFGIIYPNHPGTSKFLRYYRSGTPNHFYTTNPNELGAGASGYVFESPGAGYLHNVQVNGTVPLYRWYRGNTGQHFYTVSPVNIPGYNYESVAGYVHKTQVSGTKPLYRYFRSSAGDHFYTTNWNELGAGRSGYAYEGIECYVY